MIWPILFPTWREAWLRSDGTPQLLQEAETLLVRRGNGNHRFPRLSDAALQHAEDAAAAMGLWLQGKGPPAEVGPVDKVARAIYEQAWAVLRPSSWPRWLLLEEAFRDSSETGDLHFAALALRTMCEEIERQRLLDIDQSRFVQLAFSNLPEDQEQFARILESARSSIAPFEMNLLELPNSSVAGKTCADTELDEARTALNDYVHPNYGSQIVALYPERATAGRILLKAIVAAYRAFFALSWSEQPLKGCSRPVPVQHLSISRAVREVASRVLPNARALVPELEIPSALAWLTEPHDDAMNMLNSPEATKLLNTLPEIVKTANLTIPINGRWAGATPTALLNLALARQSESLLTREFPKGAPPVQDTSRWFSFLSRSIELILLINEVKETTFKSQLVKQLAQRNALGIELCVRSLIEHRATVLVLPTRLGKWWLETAKRFQPGSKLPQSIQELDKTIARVLAGQRNSAEPALPFASREDGQPITVSISLPTLIADAFEETSTLSKRYDLASAVIHGRILRGKDLLKDRSGKEANSACLTGLNVLDWACNSGEQKKYWFPAMQIMMNAKHAAKQVDKLAPKDNRVAHQVMGVYEGKLKRGKDYTGEGTKSTPILFREHLFYYPALHQFLSEMSIEWVGPSPLDHDDHGHLCEIYSGHDRDWWFAIPSSCFQVLMPDGSEV
jgi:hypothetical protein